MSTSETGAIQKTPDVFGGKARIRKRALRSGFSSLAPNGADRMPKCWRIIQHSRRPTSTPPGTIIGTIRWRSNEPPLTPQAIVDAWAEYRPDPRRVVTTWQPSAKQGC